MPDKIQSQKGFSTVYYIIGKVCMKKTKTVAGNFKLSTEKRVTDSCALHKMFLVVFFHHRALLLLPQSSYSTNTGSSRASLNCLCQCDTECPTMACIAVYCSHELFLIPVK